jgi:TonB family protein
MGRSVASRFHWMSNSQRVWREAINVRRMITRHRSIQFAAAVFVALMSVSSVCASPQVTEEEARQWAISTPQPKYPESARPRRATGSGFFILRVRIKTGQVKEVTIQRSTGDKTLNTAAIQTLRRWRFKPGVLPSIRRVDPKTKDPSADEDSFIGVPVTFDDLSKAGSEVQ